MESSNSLKLILKKIFYVIKAYTNTSYKNPKQIRSSIHKPPKTQLILFFSQMIQSCHDLAASWVSNGFFVTSNFKRFKNDVEISNIICSEHTWFFTFFFWEWRIQKRRLLKPLRLHHSNNLVGFNQTSQIFQFIHHKSSKLRNVLVFIIVGLGLVGCWSFLRRFQGGKFIRTETWTFCYTHKMYRFPTLLGEIWFFAKKIRFTELERKSSFIPKYGEMGNPSCPSKKEDSVWKPDRRKQRF